MKRVIDVIDQREAQKWPGRGYPTSKMVVYMLREAGLLRPLKPLRVVDMTFGQGIWWMGLQQARMNWWAVLR